MVIAIEMIHPIDQISYSYFIFLILRYMDALEFTTQRHTARNIQAALLNTLTKYEVAPPQILGIVTDSPLTMI